MNKKYLIGGMVLGVLILAVSLWLNAPKDVSGALDMSNATDLIGTKVGTTTTGVGFYTKNTATTTYPFFIGGAADNVVITIQPTAASSSANIHFEVLASNDTSCNTATTSADYLNPVLMSQINWFDAGPFIENSTAVSGLDNSTTSIYWANPISKVGQTLLLTNVNANCLALRISASSTIIWAQYKYRGSY